MHRGHYFLSSQKNIGFSYVVDGKRHYVTIGPGNEHGEAFVVMAGDGDGFPVRCDVSVSCYILSTLVLIFRYMSRSIMISSFSSSDQFNFIERLESVNRVFRPA